ncbi:MAG: site-2 protease family protein [Clostridiales bacterium]|nr:site-2 protease family protein [Clostridiales bacterium]
MISYFLNLLASFLAVMVVVTVHEYAHAYVAVKYGDPTPQLNGRLSLNPMQHFDPLGILMFALAGFGWAKPVPINPYNFRDYKKGCLFTSSAGIIVNYFSAFLFYPLYLLIVLYFPTNLSGTYAAIFFPRVFLLLYTYSLSFSVFNLLPLYPLDGFRIMDALNKKRGKVYQFLRQNSYYILLGLILLSILADYSIIFSKLNVLGYLMRFATNVLAQPITFVWGKIFGIL